MLSLNFFAKQSKISFILTCVDLLLQGFANAISFYSTLGICGYFPNNCIVKYSMGQGVAGILMNLINYACVFTVESEDVKVSVKGGSDDKWQSQ